MTEKVDATRKPTPQELTQERMKADERIARERGDVDKHAPMKKG
jgi:hypothetical protein